MTLPGELTRSVNISYQEQLKELNKITIPSKDESSMITNGLGLNK